MDYIANPKKFNASLHAGDEYKDMLNYMGNEEKSDGTFDLKKDHLTEKDIREYREKEKISRSIGNPKYLGVISFDNEFLEEHGLITPLGLDVKKLKEIARAGMSELIKTSNKLNADNVEWVGGIHTNTDNVHIHFQFFETKRTRPIEENDLLEVKAFNALKSKVVNKIIGNEKTIELTNLMRNALLPDFRNTLTGANTKLVKLAKILPDNAQYNRPKMRKYRKDINACVLSIINSNPQLKKSFEEYQEKLDEHSLHLKRLYGGGKRRMYTQHKIKRMRDFYERAGNSLIRYIEENGLKNLVENEVSPYDENFSEEYTLSEEKNKNSVLFDEDDSDNSFDDFDDFMGTEYYNGDIGTSEDISNMDMDFVDVYSDENLLEFEYAEYEENFPDEYEYPDLDFEQEEIPDFYENEYILSEKKREGDVYIDWTDAYKEAQTYRFGDKETEKNIQTAVDILILEAEDGNVLANYDLGNIYSKNLLKIDENQAEELANSYFIKAFEGFNKLSGTYTSDKMNEYVDYRIGKMYSLGAGVEQDYEKAYFSFLKAPNNQFAQYELGKLFYRNEDYKDIPKAIEQLELSSKQGNQFAQYTLGKIYYTNEDYKDTSKAIEQLELSSKQGNQYAQYLLGKIYYTDENHKDTPKAIEQLELSSKQGNQFAQYMLGKVYSTDGDYKDIPKAIEQLELSSKQGNQFAQYMLGKTYYTDVKHQNTAKAIEQLNLASSQGNIYAKNLLARMYRQPQKRKVTPTYIAHKRKISQATDRTMERLYNEYERHINRLKREFEYEQELGNHRSY